MIELVTPARYKLEATLNQSEENDVTAYLKKHNISRYNLVRRSVFEKIKNQNAKLSQF